MSMLNAFKPQKDLPLRRFSSVLLAIEGTRKWPAPENKK